MQEADGTVSLPDESVIWTQVGFAPDKFVALAGTPGHCDYFAGSTEFPIEGWNGGSFRVYGE
jgi:hypothetical protein